jgi:hypothetical protein
MKRGFDVKTRFDVHIFAAPDLGAVNPHRRNGIEAFAHQIDALFLHRFGGNRKLGRKKPIGAANPTHQMLV